MYQILDFLLERIEYFFYNPPIMEEVKTGTTILAITTNDAVILAADTRTSSGTFIPSKISDKITHLHSKIYCLRSGSAADTLYIADLVSKELRYYSTFQEVTVKLAATIAQDLIYRGDFLAGMIVAGFDHEGPSCFSISVCGTMVKNEYAIAGSGSLFLYSFFDENFSQNMNSDDALLFGKRAVCAAIRRDNFSGGCVRLARITGHGVERYFIPGNEF